MNRKQMKFLFSHLCLWKRFNWHEQGLMSCFYRKSRFVHANTRMVSEGKLSHIISLSHLRSPLPPLSFFSFCPRVLWSGRSDLGEPELVWTLSVCRGALRKLSGHNQGPWLLFEADCRCIIGSLSPRGRGNTHTHTNARTHTAPHYRAEPPSLGTGPST